MNKEMRINLASEGHIVHPERNSYTHRAFAKQISPDTLLQYRDKPVWNGFLGRYVQIGDLLPERVALAVDDKGNVVDQREFQENYRAYLNGFGLPKRDPNLEPCPAVLRYLLVWTDKSFPEDDGRFVELGFTPTAVRCDEPENTGGESVAVTQESSDPEPEMVTAPCGKSVKARGIQLHRLRCGQPECVSLRENGSQRVN